MFERKAALQSEETPSDESKSTLVSIVVNSFNYERFLAQTIESAISQTYSNVEVIVVDDGSSDGSLDVIRSFKGKVKSIFKQNGGQASALNAGFQESKGDLILFLDSDDALDPECIEKALAAWIPGSTKLQFPLKIIDGEGNETGHLKPPMHLMPADVSRAARQVGSYLFPPTSGNLYARSYLLRVMPMPEAQFITHPDAYLCGAAPFFGPVTVLRKPLGFYRIHGKNNHILIDQFGINTDMLHKDIIRDQNLRQIVKTLCERHSIPTGKNLFAGYPQLKLRLISKKLTRNQHPIKGDHAVVLTLMAIRQLWKDSDAPLAKRILLPVWLLAVCISPKKVAKLIMRLR